MSRIAQVTVTVSAVVVAVCAVVLTVRATTGGLPLVVHQQMTFNSEELAKRVQKILGEKGDIGGSSGSMACPQNVAIVEDAEFGCSFVHNGKAKIVRVVIVDADTGAIEVGQPQG